MFESCCEHRIKASQPLPFFKLVILYVRQMHFSFMEATSTPMNHRPAWITQCTALRFRSN